MGYVGLSDPFLRVAFWVAVVSAVLILLSTLRIVVLRIGILRKQKQKQRFLDQWRPLIVSWVSGDDAIDPPVLPRAQRISFLLLWMHYHENLQGNATEALNRLATRVGAAGFLPDLLKHGSLDEKLVAAAAAGHLRSVEMTDVLWHYARQPMSALSLTAVRSLCQIHSSRAAKFVVPLMVERTDWPLAKIGSILAEAGLDFIHRYVLILERIYEEQPEKLPRLLKVLSMVDLNRPLRLVRHILETDNPPELTAAALRLVGHPDELPLVRKRLRDPFWSVRVQAVTKLGSLGGLRDLDAIAELLHDYEWWVRYRAAQALEQLPGMTPKMLEKIFAEAMDPFARDMLTQVAAELGGEPKWVRPERDHHGSGLLSHPAHRVGPHATGLRTSDSINRI